MVSTTSSRILSATKYVNTSEQPSINSNDKIHSTNEILYHHSHASPMLELNDDEIISPTTITRKQTADIQSRNDTSLSKPLWTDDDEQINVSDEYTTGERTSTSQSILFRHQNSSTSTIVHTPMPTLPQVNKKSSLPSTTQKFFHHQEEFFLKKQSQYILLGEVLNLFLRQPNSKVDQNICSTNVRLLSQFPVRVRLTLPKKNHLPSLDA